MNSRRFLETYEAKSRADTSDVPQNCKQFSAISQNLVAKGKLDSFTQSRWFFWDYNLLYRLKSSIYLYELDPDLGFVGERLNKLSKRTKKSAKRNAKRSLSSLEADKNPEQAISALGEVAKPLELGDRLDPLTTAVAAEKCHDKALETKNSRSALDPVSGSQLEGEWQEIISMPIRES